MNTDIVKNLPERLVRADFRSLFEDDWMDLKQHKKAEREIDEDLLLIQYLESIDADFDDLSNFSDKKIKEAKEWRKSLF